MLRKVGSELYVERDDPAVVESLADRREEKRPSTVVGSGFDDPVRPHPADDFLVGHEICRRLLDALAEPCRVAPREASPRGFDEVELQLVRDRGRLGWKAVAAVHDA